MYTYSKSSFISSQTWLMCISFSSSDVFSVFRECCIQFSATRSCLRADSVQKSKEGHWLIPLIEACMAFTWQSSLKWQLPLGHCRTVRTKYMISKSGYVQTLYLRIQHNFTTTDHEEMQSAAHKLEQSHFPCRERFPCLDFKLNTSTQQQKSH